MMIKCDTPVCCLAIVIDVRLVAYLGFYSSKFKCEFFQNWVVSLFFKYQKFLALITVDFKRAESNFQVFVSVVSMGFTLWWEWRRNVDSK